MQVSLASNPPEAKDSISTAKVFSLRTLERHRLATQPQPFKYTLVYVYACVCVFIYINKLKIRKTDKPEEVKTFYSDTLI